MRMLAISLWGFYCLFISITSVSATVYLSVIKAD
jgi:hypothetical protein